MSVSIRDEWNRVIDRESLTDPSWVLDLEEFDEPPLFSRSADVSFLEKLPELDRGPLLLELALEQLDRVLRALERRTPPRPGFACVTLMDWDRLRAGDQKVVTPCLFVSPKPEIELAHFRVVSGASPEALTTMSWIKAKSIHDVVVADSNLRAADEVQRVYVGHRVSTSPSVWTLERFGA